MFMSAAEGPARRGLATCFRDNQSLVHGVVLDRCGDTAVAEEITAQTFEAAARRFARGRGREVTAAWLVVVAKRRLVDHWRTLDAARRAVERLAVVESSRPATAPSGVDSDITAALDALPPRQRTVLTLRYLDDWGVDEIAEGLGISYRATESLLARARRSFAAAVDAPSHGSERSGSRERRTR